MLHLFPVKCGQSYLIRIMPVA